MSRISGKKEGRYAKTLVKIQVTANLQRFVRRPTSGLTSYTGLVESLRFTTT